MHSFGNLPGNLTMLYFTTTLTSQRPAPEASMADPLLFSIEMDKALIMDGTVDASQSGDGVPLEDEGARDELISATEYAHFAWMSPLSSSLPFHDGFIYPQSIRPNGIESDLMKLHGIKTESGLGDAVDPGASPADGPQNKPMVPRPESPSQRVEMLELIPQVEGANSTRRNRGIQHSEHRGVSLALAGKQQAARMHRAYRDQPTFDTSAAIARFAKLDQSQPTGLSTVGGQVYPEDLRLSAEPIADAGKSALSSTPSTSVPKELPPLTPVQTSPDGSTEWLGQDRNQDGPANSAGDPQRLSVPGPTLERPDPVVSVASSDPSVELIATMTEMPPTAGAWERSGSVGNGFSPPTLHEQITEAFRSSLETMIRAVEQDPQGDVNGLRLRLHPENLGDLDLRIAVEKGVLSAHFAAQSEQVRALIEASLPELKQYLHDHGYTVEDLSVGVGDQSSPEDSASTHDPWAEVSAVTEGDTPAQVDEQDPILTQGRVDVLI